MDISRCPSSTLRKPVQDSTYLGRDINHARISISHENICGDDSLSTSTAFAIFYNPLALTAENSNVSSTLRQYKGSCPLASEERLSLLGDSSINLVSCSDIRPNGSVINKGNFRGSLNENGTLVANANNIRANLSCNKGIYENNSHHSKEFGKTKNMHKMDEVGKNFNDTITNDDCVGDKTKIGEKEVSSKSLSISATAAPSPAFHANSAFTEEAHSPYPSASTTGTKKISGNVDDGCDLKNCEKSGEMDDSSNEVEKKPFKKGYSNQFFAAFAANFGALALGAVLSWTSPALPDLREKKTIGEITTEEETWISAIALLGAAASCPIIGNRIERWGRKICLLVLNIPFLLGWILIVFAQNIWMIYVGRFLTGFAGGGGSIAIPVYVTESSSANIRGMLGSGFDMMITVGILYAFVVGTFVSWQWQAVACGLLPIVFHILMMLVPESPTYLVEQGNIAGASSALQWLRGASSSQQVEQELQELISSVKKSQNNSATWKDLLKRSTLTPTILAIALMIFQQLAATDAIMFTVVDIFASSSVDVNENLSANIVGVFQVVATITAALLVDHGGRRILLLFSNFFMFLSLTSMGIFFYLKMENGGEPPHGLAFLPLTSLIVYVFAFSVGMGPLPWLLMGELLPLHVKGKASGIVTITRWILGFSVTFLFQYLMKYAGAHVCYWVFGICVLVGGIFILFFLPETKGKTLDEIQEYFSGSRTLHQTDSSNEDEPEPNKLP